jgi:hypothetical protein
MPQSTRDPQPTTTTTTTSFSPTRERCRAILNFFQINLINLFLRIWVQSAIPTYCLLAHPFTTTGYWLVVASTSIPKVTIANMPAASEEGLCSSLRAAIGVWCVWPRLKAENAWLSLGKHLVVTWLARVLFGLLLVDSVLEFYLVRGGLGKTWWWW